MHKHKPSRNPQPKRSIVTAAKETMSHLVIIAVISIAGHMATALLSPAAGALGMALYPSVGGMGFMYGA